MSNSLECPVCGQEFRSEPLKAWRFRFYDVRRFECPKCKTRFNVYESPESKFTIPKAKR